VAPRNRCERLTWSSERRGRATRPRVAQRRKPGDAWRVTSRTVGRLEVTRIHRAASWTGYNIHIDSRPHDALATRLADPDTRILSTTHHGATHERREDHRNSVLVDQELRRCDQGRHSPRRQDAAQPHRRLDQEPESDHREG